MINSLNYYNYNYIVSLKRKCIEYGYCKNVHRLHFMRRKLYYFNIGII